MSMDENSEQNQDISPTPANPQDHPQTPQSKIRQGEQRISPAS